MPGCGMSTTRAGAADATATARSTALAKPSHPLLEFFQANGFVSVRVHHVESIGHPLGMSGTRLVGTVARETARRDGRYGLATMCIGVGQGIAMLLERAT